MRNHTLISCLLSATMLFQCDNADPVRSDTGSDALDSLAVAHSFQSVLKEKAVHLIKPRCKQTQKGWELVAEVITMPYTLGNEGKALHLTIRHPYQAPADSFELKFKYTRTSSSDKIEGVWHYENARVSYEGDSTDEVYISAERALFDYLNQGFDNIIKITPHQVSTYAHEDSSSLFVAELSSSLNRQYNLQSYAIQVDSLSKTSIRLIGKVSGDTVEITSESAGIIRFESSKPDQETYTYVPGSLSCPNPIYPHWFEEQFIALNYVN